VIEKFQQRFIEEARENCDRLEQHLLELEQDVNNPASVDEIFRIVHSLKGSGGMFGFQLLSEFTHELESVYQLIRDGKLQLNPAIVSFTLKCTDVMRNLLTPVIPAGLKSEVMRMKQEASEILSDNTRSEEITVVAPAVEASVRQISESRCYYIYFEPDSTIFQDGTNPLYLIDELNTLGDCRVEADLTKVPLPETLQTEKCYTLWRAVLTTEVPAEEIEDIFLFVRENSRIVIREIPVKDPLNEAIIQQFLRDDPEAAEQRIRMLGKEEDDREEAKVPAPDELSPATIRVEAARVDEYMNLVSELITAQSRLLAMAENRGDKELAALAEHFDKIIHQMRDNAFDMSMVPLYSVATRFRRLVRDLSSELNKKVRLVLDGLETEADKNVIEKLVNPMVHILRNCIDHGIEDPAKRAAAGKDNTGTITVSAGYAGNSVEIRIQDDGRGLDLPRIRQKALEKGWLNEEDEPDEESLKQMIFKPGFTTSEQLTDVSGRGIGLDAASKVISDLRGDISVESTSGRGTCFIISVPLTLSIIDGLLIRISNDTYIIPTAGVQKIYPLVRPASPEEVLPVKVFEGKQIPWLDLGREFYGPAGEPDRRYLIAVSYKDKEYGLAVDDVLREYQAVVKPVSKVLRKTNFFMGASILGNGEAALVLDVQAIIQKFLL
jgi:two-component system chemotaxis sensor kinase CheA